MSFCIHLGMQVVQVVQVVQSGLVRLFGPPVFPNRNGGTCRRDIGS